MSEEIITNSIDKSKYFYTKAEKILSYRKKYSSIRHEYFVMAQNYMSYNKVLLTFTVPTDRKDKSIKNGRYTKLRTLIEIRAYIAKLLNNSSDVKYFMNIELGEHYSNPHLHLQLWHNTTSSLTTNIFEKTISKFNLNKNRCYITEPTHAVPIYNYVIKDYAKDLSDKQIWDLETQKKRFRKVMGSKVRFYSKSRDEFSKKIYRKIYYGMGILRKNANEFINFFIDNFFYFNKRNLPKINFFLYCFSELSNIEQEQLLSMILLFKTIFAAWGKWSVDVLFYSPCLDPPFFYCLFILQVKNLFKGVTMLCFIFVLVVLVLVFICFVRIRGPTVM